MKVHIITVGDEILIGQIVDTNSAWMAKQLNLVGAQVIHITTASDEHSDIIAALERGIKSADVVLITGGLGPTKDDITKKTLAEFFNTQMIFHQPTYDRILRLFQRWGRSSTPAHREQSYMPKDAMILHNKMGTAPGMWFEKDGRVVISMPGVPYEMKYLMEKEVIPRLKDKFPGQPIAHRTILTVGEGESRIAKRIEDIEERLPPFIKLAFLPGLGQVRLRLTGTGVEEVTLNRELDKYAAQIEARIPEFIFGHGTEKLEAVIGHLLKERELSLGTAESCTGGHLAHRITTIAGSSAYFKGGVIAYSNEVKMAQLGVAKSTLEQHGAVSEQTVIEMVKGAIDLLQIDIAISVSGIAGPDGGTPEKPVGTIWMAVGNTEIIKTHKLQIGKDRIKNIEYTSVRALNLVRMFLQEHYQTVGLAEE